ncbi:MAG: GatB/YqeY domain-containing protein [Alphaproteobacteria bacterium]|nr:GatB/YqeY domain-containing protein [Alphaproteobacteria bacterium]
MDIREKFKDTMKESMKSKDQMTLATVRLILSSLKDKDIAARAKGNMDGIPEGEILSLLQSMVKQRQESAKIYKDAGRAELAAQEESEIGVIERFLPRQMDDAGMDAAVAAVIAEIGAAGIKDMGKVMAELKTRFAGQMDMGKAGGIVKAKLG